jgi:hypothetical protein
MKKLFDQYGLRKKIISYVKNKWSNLNAMIVIILKSIVKCQVLPINEHFQGICFGHGFSKACQYLTTNEKVCKKLRFISIKST